MRWAVLLVVAGCVASRGAWRERVGEVERSAPTCRSFSEWDEHARAASESAAKEAPAEELLASGKHVRTARLSCARHVMETLIESKHRQQDLDAVAAALDEQSFSRLVTEVFGSALDASLSAMLQEARERAGDAWRRKRDAQEQSLLAEASTSKEQRDKRDLDAISGWGLQHDGIDVEENGSHVLPDGGTARFPAEPRGRTTAFEHDRQFVSDHDRLAAESAEHDRLAATSSTGTGPRAKDTAGDDARLAAESAAHDRQFARDRAAIGVGGGVSASDDAHLQAESAAHDRQFREDAARLASVGGDGSVTGSSDAWSRVQPALQRARAEKRPDAVATLLEPFREDPVHGAEATAAASEAAQQHLALARDAGARTHAAALHRALVARFGSGTFAPTPGTFVFERWLCPGEKPTPPLVASGVSVRLRVRCQTSRAKPSARSETEPVFESERAMVKLTTDGVVSITCGAQSFERALHREALSVDAPEDERRRLEDDFKNLAREARSRCEALVREESAPDCAAVATEAPLDVEERFAAHTLSPSGPWPTCFVEWFRARYGVAP